MKSEGLLKVIGGLVFAAIVILGRNCDDVIRASGPVLRETAPRAVADAAPGLERQAGRVAPHIDEAATGAAIPKSKIPPAEMHPLKSSADSALSAAARTDDQWRPFPGEVVERTSISTIRNLGTGPIRKPHLLAAFPANEIEYVAVFGKSLTASASKEVKRLAAEVNGYSRASQWSKPPPKTELRSTLQALDDPDLVVIIAHAEEEGAILVLPTGQRMRHLEVHEVCAAVEVRCVVLSCHSQDLQFTSEITTTDALSMWALAERAWTKEAAMSADEYIRALREARVTLTARRNIALTAIAVGTVVGAGGTHELLTSRQRK